jgi:hypothetical protein
MQTLEDLVADYPKLHSYLEGVALLPDKRSSQHDKEEGMGILRTGQDPAMCVSCLRFGSQQKGNS